jgi:hypothetical protein
MKPGWWIIAVAIGLFIFILVFAIVHQQKKREPYVIGENLARANALEQQRKLKGDAGKSPLPDNQYDFWRGEQSLINPHKIPLDSTLGDLCQDFTNRDEPARQQIRHSISMDEFYTLLTFSMRAAVFAMREQNKEWLVKGLTALSMIEAKRTDFRDILVALSLLHHSAQRIQANPDQLLRNAAALSEPDVSKLITEFIERPPDDKDLRTSWGQDEVETKDGTGFIGWGFKSYHPTYDLKRLSLEIADLIASDKYQPQSIDVATDLPAVWLKSPENPAVETLIGTARGGASIHAWLRPNEHPQAAQQTLMVFLIEVPDKRTAQALLEMSKRKKPAEHGMIGVAENNLFCLVIGESTTRGVDSFETTEKLNRFSKGIAELLLRYSKQV